MDKIVEETKEERQKRLQRERSRRYRHSEKGQEKAKLYRLRNRPKLLEGKKKHREENRERYKLNDKNYYEKNKEIINQKNKERYRKSYDHYRDLEYQKRYNISLQEYEKIWNDQDGKCKICDCSESSLKEGRYKRLVVDHCHITGKVRGLLCNNCNRAIGLLKDNVQVLNSAIKYLTN